MELAFSALLKAAEVALLVAISPLITSVIKKLKARLQCRQGPGLLQTYRDLWKLFRKGRVLSHDASFVFRMGPAVILGATLGASLVVPVLFARADRPEGALMLGDAIMLVGLLSLARFFTALGALDTGGAFGGMGAAREMTVAALTEPVLALVIVGVAVGHGTTDLSTLAAVRSAHWSVTASAGTFIGLAAALIILLTESGRLPVDNPDTHLELTMLHEGMILEHSGPGLGCIVLATHLKQALVMALIVDLFFPLGISTILGSVSILVALFAFLAKALLLAVVMAVIESSVAKLRFFMVPDLMVAGLALAFVALIVRSM